MAYATIEQLRSYDRNFSSTDNDSDLSDLLTRASGMVDLITGLSFSTDTDLRRYDADRDVDGRTLYLDCDLHTITTITNGDGAALNDTDYVTEPRNDTPYYAITLKSAINKVWEHDTDGDPEDAISVDGAWGFVDSDNTPSEIVHATMRLALILYDLPRSGGAEFDRPLITSEGIVIGSQQLPHDLATILRHYRGRSWSVMG